MSDNPFSQTQASFYSEALHEIASTIKSKAVQVAVHSSADYIVNIADELAGSNAILKEALIALRKVDRESYDRIVEKVRFVAETS